MSHDPGLYAWVEEALAPIGSVNLRRMMGAATLYLDGIVFAVIDGDELWLKADAESDALWDEAGCERFTFTSKEGETMIMNYRRAPGDVYDDPDQLRHWALIAQAAGLRSAAKKRKKKTLPPDL